MTITDISTARVPQQRTADLTTTPESQQLADLEARIAECKAAIEQHPEWSDVARKHLGEYETRRAELVALTATTALAA